LVGVALLAGTGWRLRSGQPPGRVTVGNIALYWHLVDIVWVFLFPVLYLSR
jgi:cytochrome c oxidase subunit 3